MGAFRSRRYLQGDRLAWEPETGATLRWGVPSAGGDPCWLLVGASVVEATSTAPWRFRGLESVVASSPDVLPLADGTLILHGRRLLVMEHGEPRELGTITPTEGG